MLDARVVIPPALLWAGLAFSPAAVAIATDAQPASALSPPLRSPQVQAQFHVMAGEMAAGRQMPEMAAEEFLRALELAPSAELAARATAMALAAQRDDLALIAARKWLAVDETALEAREIIARQALRSGQSAEALAQCAAIIKGHPGGELDGFRHVALLLSQERDKAPAALALMRNLVAERPQFAGAQRALALLAFRFDDAATAEKAARAALKLSPGDRESTLLLVGALVKKGDIAGSAQTMDALLGAQKDGNELRMGYAKLLIDAEQRPAAREQLLLVLKSDAANTDAHFALGLLAMDERKIEDAEAHFNSLLDKPDRQHDAAYYLGRIAELRRQPQVALGWYEKVQGGNQSLDAFVRRARMLGLLKRLPEGRELLAGLRQQFPPLSARLYAAEGELLSENAAYLDALNLYEAALKANPDDGDLIYARSLVHERMNRFDLAETDLRKLIAKNPDDARSLNALGYLLTVHGSRYDEAARLISRAHSQEPNDPAVLDSMGWVLFKQGKAKEALPYLQKAHELFPDPEVAAHLGETLWSLGEKDKARALWQAALKDDPEHRVLKETVQRLSGP